MRYTIKNIFNKANAPYLAVGVLATLTLLASGVFAVAPYIGFLAPVAALSVGLPFIIGCAVFSVVTIALSYAAVSKNKTISEKVTEISGKDAKLVDQAKEIEGKDKAISEKDAQLANQAKEIEGKDKAISEKDTKIEKDAPKVAIVDGTVQLAKGTLSGIGSGVKNTCGALIASVRGALNSVGSSLYSRIYGTKVSSPEEQFKREDGSKPSMQELTRLDYLNLEVLSSGQKQRANSLDY